MLAGCSAGTGHPAGAPPIDTAAPVGANEQLPGATTADDSPVPTPATPAVPIDQTFTCPEQTISPLTSAQLKSALRDARPGDAIYLEPITYTGNFTATAKGTAERPIYLCGPAKAELDGKSRTKGYTLHLDGAENWRVGGFTVLQGAKGIMIDHGRHNVLQGLKVAETGDEAVHLRDGSSDNIVRDLHIAQTGTENAKFGEGIYIGSAQGNWCEVSDCKPDRSDRNQILGNNISRTTAEAVDVKEGTSDGVIAGNFFNGLKLSGADSWVDVKGNGWKITGNKGKNSPEDGFQTHQIVAGWGDGNVFSANTAKLNGGSGVGFALDPVLKNKVTCDNTVSGAAHGLSDVPCRS